MADQLDCGTLGLILLLCWQGSQCVTTGPLNTGTELGHPLRLNCSSTIVPGMYFNWYVVDPATGTNRVTIAGCLSPSPPPPYIFIVSPNSCDMLLMSVAQADALVYRCEPLGDTSASAAAVVLDSSPLSISASPGNDIPVNTTVSVTCTLKYTSAMYPGIEWDTDGLTIESKSRFQQPGELEETVVLIPVITGEYNVTCSASFTSRNLVSVPDINQNQVTLDYVASVKLNVTDLPPVSPACKLAPLLGFICWFL